jgi:very-short-patch-repair endonuclease
MKICKRCNKEYDISMISIKYLDKHPDRYEYCTNCRKYKNCEYCGKEFKHKQNRTCSMECANKLKELSFLQSCGATHNFNKNSKSRSQWESKLLINEGIVNVFQRKEVKEKSKKTIKEKYGVDHISRSDEIKKIKKDKIKYKIKKDPTYYKRIWMDVHKSLVNELGYDPRLHVLGKASKSSLKVFNEVIRWCLDNNIDYDDIYIGIDNKNEFFLRDNINDRFFMYDFTIKSKKIIIEYHGIAFHAKKNDKNWKNVFTNESSKENIKNKNIKNNLAISKGFKILEIWSDDDVEFNIQKCKKFIKKFI